LEGRLAGYTIISHTWLPEDIVKVKKALDERGNQFTLGASKFLARVIQHELDHLDGVLFIDKVKRFIDVTKNTKKDEERL